MKYLSKLFFICAIVLLPSVSFAALTDDLVSYWKLDEVSGARFDAHASNDLTDNNTVGSASGIINLGALYIDSAERLSISDASPFDFERTDEFSFMAWVNISDLSTSAVILDHQLNSNLRGYIWQILTNGKMRIQFGNNNDGSNSIYVDTTNTVVTTGVWKQVLVTYDGSSSSSGFSYYVDGVSTPATSVINNLNATTINNSELAIGNVQASNINFSGVLDELAIWSRVLTSDEVDLLYNSGSALAYPFTPSEEATSTATTTDTMSKEEQLLFIMILIILLGVPFWRFIFSSWGKK